MSYKAPLSPCPLILLRPTCPYSKPVVDKNCVCTHTCVCVSADLPTCAKSENCSKERHDFIIVNGLTGLCLAAKWTEGSTDALLRKAESAANEEKQLLVGSPQKL